MEQDYLTLREAARFLTGRGGKKPHTETLRRWITQGCSIPGGDMLRLKATRISGTWLLRRQWIDEFARLRLLAGLVGS